MEASSSSTPAVSTKRKRTVKTDLQIVAYDPQGSKYAPRVTNTQWLEHKTFLQQVHHEKHTRQQMQKALEERGLSVTIAQLNARMIKWGMKVYESHRKFQHSTAIEHNAIVTMPKTDLFGDNYQQATCPNPALSHLPQAKTEAVSNLARHVAVMTSEQNTSRHSEQDLPVWADNQSMASLQAWHKYLRELGDILQTSATISKHCSIPRQRSAATASGGVGGLEHEPSGDSQHDSTVFTDDQLAYSILRSCPKFVQDLEDILQIWIEYEKVDLVAQQEMATIIGTGPEDEACGDSEHCSQERTDDQSAFSFALTWLGRLQDFKNLLLVWSAKAMPNLPPQLQITVAAAVIICTTVTCMQLTYELVNTASTHLVLALLAAEVITAKDAMRVQRSLKLYPIEPCLRGRRTGRNILSVLRALGPPVSHDLAGSLRNCFSIFGRGAHEGRRLGDSEGILAAAIAQLHQYMESDFGANKQPASIPTSETCSIASNESHEYGLFRRMAKRLKKALRTASVDDFRDYIAKAMPSPESLGPSILSSGLSSLSLASSPTSEEKSS